MSGRAPVLSPSGKSARCVCGAMARWPFLEAPPRARARRLQKDIEEHPSEAVVMQQDAADAYVARMARENWRRRA